MATTKKQAFDIPFIGYDYGKDFNWDFDVLFGQFGNPIIGIKIKNMVEYIPLILITISFFIPF